LVSPSPERPRETSGEPAEGSLLFLDACCLLNLFATGRIEEILKLLPYRCATSRFIAEEEVLAIRRTTGTGGLLEVVSTSELEASGRLAVFEMVTVEEQRELARLGDDLDDGEASVCALAVAHQGGVATDDRKALRMLGAMSPQVPTLQTPDILFAWARLSKAPKVEVGTVLRAIRERGSFYPRKDSPHFDWWSSLVQMKEHRR
jgi:predicted nucleic acid-binding protein